MKILCLSTLDIASRTPVRNWLASHTGLRQSWVSVLAFTLAVRVLLSGLAVLGARIATLQAPGGYTTVPGLNPLTLPGVWARWDAAYYLGIAVQGYALHDTAVNFWPGYPLALRAFSLGVPWAAPWAGAMVSLVSFVLANLVLWERVRSDLGQAAAWATIVTLNLFPTAFFFSAIYSESLFLLCSVLVYWFAARRRYWLAALCVALASITRIYGILLLVLLLAELVQVPARRRLLRMAGVTCVSGSLLAVYAGYLWLTQGSPLAPVLSQQEVMKRTLALPGVPLVHGLAVALWGYGGFRGNWYMRVISAQDALALLLFLACAVAGFFVLPRRSLALYGAAAMLALAVSHGPYSLGAYSMARYVLPIFPAFMVMAAGLLRLGTLKWLVCGLMAALLCLYTIWFGTGHWVA